MSKGRKALLRAVPDYCRAYHCPGDCGKPHNQSERVQYAQSVLAAFDALGAEKRRETKDQAAEVRRKAKESF